MQNFRSRQIELLAESDGHLIEKMRRGDQIAVMELCRRYYSSLCRFTFRIVHSSEDVEDIVASVFEMMWINRRDLDPNWSIRSLLFKATRNRAIDFLRHKDDKQPLPPALERIEDDARTGAGCSSESAHDLIGGDFTYAVDQAVDKLPEKCKVIFTLNRQEGLSYPEIAEMLSISERTVEHQIVRALKCLRNSLRDYI